ncbi:MAG: hypothetical protein IAG13_13095 [Deltaproteobacteria bacterium]|nr:hypothetical protein [Nannocystaceae bacterium]
MRSLCPSLVTLLLAGGVPACFSEEPLTDSGPPGSSTGGTSGGECTLGALGCDCYGNATCDSMLECAMPAGVCVPAGCEPGQVHCFCDQDSCDEPLLCVAGICAAPSDSTGSSEASTASPDTSGGPSSSTASSTGTVDSTSDVTSDPSTTSSESSEGSSSETGPAVVCDELACTECVDCAITDEQDCGPAYDTCEATPGCPFIAVCMATCSFDGLCLDDCCDGETGAAVAAAHAVNECQTEVCAPSSCSDLQSLNCSG